MIVNKKIEIKISRKNIKYYENILNSKLELKQVINIEPKYLQKNSNIIISVKCDICGNINKIKNQAYNKNINSSKNYPIYTCVKCSHIKAKSSNKDKYGVEHYSQTEEYSKKFKNTMLERYGVEYSSQSEFIKNKIKKTNKEKYGVNNIFENNGYIRQKFKEKYGVDHPSKVSDIYDKIKKGNKKTTGYESALSSPMVRDKIKKTNDIRYSGHPTKHETVKNKIKKTSLEKYKHKSVLPSPIIKEKIKNTISKKYGVDNPTKSEFVRKNYIITNEDNYIKYLNNSLSLFSCDKGHNFTINIDNYHSRRKNNTPLCTLCNPISNSSSIKEDELYDFIKTVYNDKILRRYRDGLEIDIYIPELNLGFEFNGLYYHSNKFKDKNYHIKKKDFFENKNIKIINIWEDDWDHKKDIIKSQIMNWLNISENKIYARKCNVIELNNTKLSSPFLNKNHIQGKDKSNIKLGLFYNNELVSIMTFNKNEGRKKLDKNSFNLSRFCNKLNTNVIGGGGKLLKYFEKKFKPYKILSYADYSWSDGNFYEKLDFGIVNKSKPDYKYIVNNKRVHKQNFTKKKINIPDNISESEYMSGNKILKIWDCGKIKFEKIIR